ncbi:enoyl-CoA hydratase [Paraburkholderia sp. Cy-641]|uniref:enoyl-CoA hydratase n=1 Tax=Paraburkholderia sp. Cy-641 TaxID=2608337 RepID=UPI001422AA07|nr:enoyl-CoA hydratase [Paraburkholderia sp. Cy-641]NIF80477.1 enoyl-CoA hydratase [Paraburkholderia sp. Cy-641]
MIEIDFFHEGKVALITLKRPPANAFTSDGLKSLEETIGTLDKQAQVRSVIVTGDGAKFFSAGADLNTFADGDKEVARNAAMRFGSAFEALQNARSVVIAAINGYAMGGGLECALSCDVRIAERHAVMALPEAAVGLLPCGCGTQTLPWLVGEGWAKRIVLTGERVNAETALRIGLVEEMVEKGAALDYALEMATRVATLSPEAVKFSKSLIHQARNGVPRSGALSVERERFVDLFDGADQREGVNAFLEKRSPVWSEK